MKKMIDKIRAAKTWQERTKNAKDELPGTSFDSVFEEAQLAEAMETTYRPLTRQCHERLGKWLAWIIKNRKTQVLHDMAAALVLLKRHKSKRNYDLEVLFSMSGMFPAGWTKTVANFDKAGQIIRDPKTGRPIFGAKPGTRDKIAMRDIKQNLAEIDPAFDEDEWATRRRKIQRYAKEFKISLDGAAGRPPRNLRHDSHEKLR